MQTACSRWLAMVTISAMEYVITAHSMINACRCDMCLRMYTLQGNSLVRTEIRGPFSYKSFYFGHQNNLLRMGPMRYTILLISTMYR